MSIFTFRGKGFLCLGLVSLSLGVSFFYVWVLVFLRLGVRDSYLLLLVFLRLWVWDSYAWVLDFYVWDLGILSRLGVSNSNVWGLVIPTFGC